MLAGGGDHQDAVAALAVPLQAFTGGGVDARQDIAANVALHPAGHGLHAQAGQRRQRGLHVVLHRQLTLIIELHQLLLLQFQLRRREALADQPADPQAGAVIVNQGFIQVE